MTKNKIIRNRYKKIVKEFDLCELAIAKEITKAISRASWDVLSYSKKMQYLEGARTIINTIEKYYELIPTYWVD